MKALYEVTNGWMGESYLRCYAWADSEEEALDLAQARFAQRAESKGSPEFSARGKLSCMRLFAAEGSDSFATLVSDSGWA